MKTLIALYHDEAGTTVSEYAIIGGMIAFTAFASMAALGYKFMSLLVS